MKVTLEKFKSAVNKAIKGAGFNKLIPLTSLIGIKYENNELKLIATDMINTIEAVVPAVGEDEPFNITVDADKFGKLISKITSTDIELTADDSNLTVKANGTYKLPLVTDADGIVAMPEIKRINGDKTTVDRKAIMLAYNVSRKALAVTVERPCLTGYYTDSNRIVTSDGTVITFNDVALFADDTVRLISPQMMNLLTLLTDDTIDVVCSKSGMLQFITESVVISGVQLEGLDDYPIEGILEYLDQSFHSNCKISKEYLLSIIDRLSLFIEPYDKNGAKFDFGRNGIKITSKKDSFTEDIRYVESNQAAEYSCLVDIPLLKSEVECIPDDTIELYYGNENALMIKSGNVTEIIALLDEE